MFKYAGKSHVGFKKDVFHFLLKDNIVVALRTSNGRLFHNRDAANENEYLVFVRGPSLKRSCEAERRLRSGK